MSKELAKQIEALADDYASIKMTREHYSSRLIRLSPAIIANVIERGGKPVACIKKAFQAASERSTVHATPYTLRHTGAVWAAEAGVPMAELAQFMGHDDDRTTSAHYARYGPDYLRGVANSISIKAS